MKEENSIIHLQLICMKLPVYEQEPTAFGIQDSYQEVHIGLAQVDGSISYKIDIPVTRNSETNAVRFRGIYVHGTPLVPFLYLSVKRIEGIQPTWIRRLKIPLPRLTWNQIDTTSRTTTFIARIDGTGSGTVPLLNGGWKPKDQHSAE